LRYAALELDCRLAADVLRGQRLQMLDGHRLLRVVVQPELGEMDGLRQTDVNEIPICEERLRSWSVLVAGTSRLVAFAHLFDQRGAVGLDLVELRPDNLCPL